MIEKVKERTNRGILSGESYFTTREAADRLEVSVPTFRRIVEREALEAFNDPTDARLTLYRVKDIETLSGKRKTMRRRERQISTFN